MSATKQSIWTTTVRISLYCAAAAGVCILGQRFIAISTATSNTVSAFANTVIAGRPALHAPSETQMKRREAASDEIDVALQNLANRETQAYKAQRLIFADAEGDQLGTRIVRTQLDFNQGSLESTNVNTDVAIQGEGFFKVKLPPNIGDGTGYTRNGSLYYNKNGDLVVGIGEGFRLIPNINIPVGSLDISIGEDGTVKYTPKGGNRVATAGKLVLYRFANPQNLTQQTNSIYCETSDSGVPVACNPGDDGCGQLIEGYLESSNVDPTKEWAALVKAEQSLELDRQMATVVDQARQVISDLKKS